MLRPKVSEIQTIRRRMAISRSLSAGASRPGRLASGVKGRWYVSLEDEKKVWRLTGDWLPEKNAVLKMPLQAAGEK